MNITIPIYPFYKCTSCLKRKLHCYKRINLFIDFPSKIKRENIHFTCYDRKKLLEKLGKI